MNLRSRAGLCNLIPSSSFINCLYDMFELQKDGECLVWLREKQGDSCFVKAKVMFCGALTEGSPEDIVNNAEYLYKNGVLEKQSIKNGLDFVDVYKPVLLVKEERIDPTTYKRYVVEVLHSVDTRCIVKRKAPAVYSEVLSYGNYLE